MSFDKHHIDLNSNWNDSELEDCKFSQRVLESVDKIMFPIIRRDSQIFHKILSALSTSSLMTDILKDLWWMILKELKTNEIEVIQISKKINKNKKQKWEQAKKQNEEMCLCILVHEWVTWQNY